MSYIKKNKNIIILVIWSVFLISMLVVTLTNSKSDKHKYYDYQKEASNLTLEAFNAIKERKIELGIGVSKYDTLKSGMIGDFYNEMTTTDGDIKSKLSSCNPNFGAVYISIFNEAGLKPGDQVACVLSGSFPALDVALLAAIEVFELDACIMVSVGASTYGANYPNFTIFDQLEYLYQQKILKNRIDYVSFGGNDDNGSSFEEEFVISMKKRFDESKIPFLCPNNFEENIKLRKDIIAKECPNLKLFISVGGTLVAMGRSNTLETYSYCGLIKPDYMQSNINIETDRIGLLDHYLLDGVPVAQMLFVKGLCKMYGLKYDPLVMESISEQSVYYDTTYNIVIPIICLTMSLGVCLYFGIEKRKKYKNKL